MTGEDKNIASMIDEAINDHKKFNRIISSLYSEDMERRFVAAKVLGGIARLKPEIIRQRWARIFYAFDDTMSCWGVAEALGEIARNLPEDRSKISLILRKFQRDECSCQGFIWSMCRICQVEMERVKDFIPDLMAFLDSKNPCMIGQSIWAIGELGIEKAVEKVKSFLGDIRETWLYENDSVAKKTLGEISKDALKKLISE